MKTDKKFGELIRADKTFKEWGSKISLQRKLRGLDKRYSGMQNVTKLIMKNPKIKDIEKDLLSEKINLGVLNGY